MAASVTVAPEEFDSVAEEERAHSQLAGEHAIWREVVGALSGRAGTLFADGRDDAAREVRQLAAEFKTRLASTGTRLQWFVDRSIERSKERRRR